MEPQINTTPRRREPPSKLISAARREIPNIMSGIHPDGDPDGTVHGNVIVVMIAGVLAAKIRDIGHGIAAAEWGIHQAICDGHLLVWPRFRDQRIPEEIRHRFPTDFSDGKPVDYPNLAVQSTETLWEWWDKVVSGIVDNPVPENVQKLFPKGVPEDSNIVDLVVRLNTAKGSGKSQSEVARELTGESIGNDVLAKKLLANIRTMRNRGQIRD